jgi:hypothetical protein
VQFDPTIALAELRLCAEGLCLVTT